MLETKNIQKEKKAINTRTKLESKEFRLILRK